MRRLKRRSSTLLHAFVSFFAGGALPARAGKQIPPLRRRCLSEAAVRVDGKCFERMLRAKARTQKKRLIAGLKALRHPKSDFFGVSKARVFSGTGRHG